MKNPLLSRFIAFHEDALFEGKNAVRLSMAVLLLVVFMLPGCKPPADTGTHIMGVMHANINCSSYADSVEFYKDLGFIVLMEVEDTVTAEFASGLDMPPYTIHASPIMLSDGAIIDLIEWVDPFDASVPYAGLNHQGIAAISLTTTNIDSDFAKLEALGVEFLSDPVTVQADGDEVRFVYFKDPDGTLLQLIQTGRSKAPSRSGINITGIAHINVNTPDLDQAISFYTMLGFTAGERYSDTGTGEHAAAFGMTDYELKGVLVSLRKGPPINLIEWIQPVDSGAPYAALNHLGIARIALRTKNLDADVLLLENAGEVFFAQPMKPEGNLGFLRFACFKNADGVVLELVQYDFF